jgi:polar amino acid transport system permease protein
MESIFKWNAIKDWIPFIFNGLGLTLLIALVSAIAGLGLGILVVLMSKNKIANKFAVTYVDIFRGTPLLLQLSLIYFAIPQILDRIVNGYFGHDFDFALPGLIAAFITFSLNSGAYISEVIRSGINSVDKGEIEAAKALGINSFNIYKDIILPIAFRNSFPSLMNEFITLVKESSIASVIGIQDLMRRQQIVTSQSFMYFEPLIVVGIIYYVVIKTLSYTGRKLEVRLNYGRS